MCAEHDSADGGPPPQEPLWIFLARLTCCPPFTLRTAFPPGLTFKKSWTVALTKGNPGFPGVPQPTLLLSSLIPNRADFFTMTASMEMQPPKDPQDPNQPGKAGVDLLESTETGIPVSYADVVASRISKPHQEYLLERHGTLELDPIPSMDPADPYNWPGWKVSRSRS